MRMVSSGTRTERQVLRLLKKAEHLGLFQKEIEQMLGLSKSYCSEVMTSLYSRKKVVKELEGGVNNRYFAPEYAPKPIPGLIRLGILRSSEYVPLIGLLTNALGNNGTALKFRFYNNTIGLMSDYYNGVLELCMAPTTTMVMSAAMRGGLKILTGIASGGSGVLERSICEEDVILSSETSSMTSMIIRSGDRLRGMTVKPYDDPRKGEKEFTQSGARGIVIWEPYFSRIAALPGVSKTFSYEDVMDRIPCCSLGATPEFYSTNHKVLSNVIIEYQKNEMAPLMATEQYQSAIRLVARGTGFSAKEIESSLKSYNFSSNTIDKKMLEGIGIPLSRRQIDDIFGESCLR